MQAMKSIVAFTSVIEPTLLPRLLGPAAHGHAFVMMLMMTVAEAMRRRMVKTRVKEHSYTRGDGTAVKITSSPS